MRPPPMRILLLTAYYPPELGAPQTRLRETARRLLARGHRVRVVTGPPHYPDGVVRPGYPAWRPTRERIDGLPVVRLPMLARPNGGLRDRLIDQGSFAAAALAALPEVRWSDVVVVESPPLALGASATWLGLAGRRPYLFHVADPWPDFPIAMGALQSPLLQRAAYAVEDLAYRRAALVTTVTPGLVELLGAKPGAAGKVRLLPNGVDTRRFEPRLAPAEARRRLGWPETTLTLVYAGSVGQAQGLATLLEAMTPLAGRDIALHVVGQGIERERLAADARRRGLDAVRFEPSVPADRVPTVLAAADAILVLLRRGPLYEQALPTKLVEGLAAGRPLIVSADGEAAAIVRSSRPAAGLTSPAEDAAALREAIVELAGRSPRSRAAMGRAARAVAESAYDREAIVERLEGYLASIREPRRSR
ncbi:MAG TPA: glycosyltransferase family 4 protein [Candidatus Limnocylindrales bacterium]|nr:glycosyltransferase family 4 protein [Candidatus Limnocylindrales bacterium]